MAYDLVIKGGLVHDGDGSPPVLADVAVSGDRVAAVSPGAVADVDAAAVIDATGLAVAPGFVNMLSHSHGSLLIDKRGMSELVQGVTTQIVGEGWSMGPLTEVMRDRMLAQQTRYRHDIPWLRLSEYLAHIEKQGTAQNIASYIGATTLREHAVGLDDRPATAAEIDLMRGLVREEMADGALGIASALIYPPGFFASTEELVELCRAAAPYSGKYISHLRSEGDDFEGGVAELLRIGREAEVPAEIYHLKPAGRQNWPKLAAVIETIEAARAAGQRVTADVYTYTAGGTSLGAAVPPWFHDGGRDKFLARLADGSTRAEMRAAIESSTDGWENLFLASGGGDGVMILSIEPAELKSWQGMTLTEIGADLATDAIGALLEVLVRSESRAGAAYFIMSEDNLRTNLQLPWVSLGSDAAAQAAEGEFLAWAAHPRAYGNFARFLGTYVRDEGLLSLPEAIRRLTSLPCDNLGLAGRGRLVPDAFADIVVFDPESIGDRATYADPHQYATGVHHVVVNGTVTLRDGEFTGEVAGRALHGPGRR